MPTTINCSPSIQAGVPRSARLIDDGALVALVVRSNSGAVRKLQALIEVFDLETYHMSKTIHPVGQILKGTGLPKVPQEVEDALESHRPPDRLSRLHAVYTVNTPDFSQLGILNPGYIYLVEIEDANFQRHDANWVGLLQRAQKKLEPRYATNPYTAKHWPDWTDDFVSCCSNKYWAGEASQTPRWEFLSRQAIVKEATPLRAHRPRRHNTGWQSLIDIVVNSAFSPKGRHTDLSV